MKEEFLHFIWKNKLYSGFQSDHIQQIEVLDPGRLNRDAGPDFFNARILLDGIEWAGNVEIHLRASDWQVHGHDTDEAYDAIILHVVSESDRPACNSRGELLPEVRMLFDPALHEKYREYLFSPAWVPCAKDFPHTELLLREQWVSRLATERMQEKTANIRKVLEETAGDWEEVFYQYLSRHLGMRVNAEPMEQLARSVPLRFLRKHFSDPVQVEAFLFGQAGLLEPGILPSAVKDDYFSLLYREYIFLKNKFSLDALPVFRWKFHRLRPANFPTIRMAQLAAILMKNPHLFAGIRETDDIPSVMQFFEAEVSEYWKAHYLFGKKKNIPFSMGKQARLNLMINVVVPVLFAYGKERDQRIYTDRALHFMESLPPENNRIVRGWKELGVEFGDALHSQAFLQLKNVYCDHRRCLDCRIGEELISRNKGFLPGEQVLLEPKTPKRNAEENHKQN